MVMINDRMYERVSEEPLQDKRAQNSLTGHLFYAWTMLAAAVLLLLGGLPALVLGVILKRPGIISLAARRGVRLWLKVSGMKVVVRGKEHLDSDRAYLFVSNHRSYLDTVTLFSYTGRKMGMIAKKELFKVPILGQGMGHINILAIDRSKLERAIKTLRHASELLKSGVSLGVFAEGTRALPGQMLPFKKGPFKMAMEVSAPIVPVAIKNTDRLMGKGTGVAIPGVIEMVLLPVVETDWVKTDEDLKALMKMVQKRVGDELGVALP
jgi:1-acyl-sn-glycerol-3-phosphate acyltransferase